MKISTSGIPPIRVPTQGYKSVMMIGSMKFMPIGNARKDFISRLDTLHNAFAHLDCKLTFTTIYTLNKYLKEKEIVRILCLEQRWIVKTKICAMDTHFLLGDARHICYLVDFEVRWRSITN